MPDKLVALVDQMLEVQKELTSTETDKDTAFYENKVAGLDSEIDEVTYKLYGLSADEVRIIEQTDLE
jgi:adenine-specific DNA-methyltransferase